jgi:hypothetical protein
VYGQADRRHRETSSAERSASRGRALHTFRPASIVMAAVLSVGCRAQSDPKIAALQQRQETLAQQVAADEQRAAALRVEAVRLQHVLVAQQQCLAWQECDARRARVDARVVALLGECNMRTANWYACDAQRARDTAEGAGLGCLLGWAAAAVTGGAAAPAVLIGCGAGAVVGGSSPGAACKDRPPPQPCGSMQSAFLERALALESLASMPYCGPMPQECTLLGLPR